MVEALAGLVAGVTNVAHTLSEMCVVIFQFKEHIGKLQDILSRLS